MRFVSFRGSFLVRFAAGNTRRILNVTFVLEFGFKAILNDFICYYFMAIVFVSLLFLIQNLFLFFF